MELTYMAGASANTRDAALLISSLRRDRITKFHILHPENPNIHPTRSVYHSKLINLGPV